MQDRVWSAPRYMQALGWALVVLMLSLTGLLLAAPVRQDREAIRFMGALVGLPVTAWWAYRMLVHPYVVATGRALEVHNPFRTYRIEWAAIEGFDTNPYGIIIKQRGARQVTARAVPKSVWSIWRGKRTRADAVVHEWSETASGTTRRSDQSYRVSPDQQERKRRSAGWTLAIGLVSGVVAFVIRRLLSS